MPASIILIFVLLFSAFGSVRYATLILANLPFALIGGILVLWIRDINLSVSAAVGFIALFGISVQNGVVLVTEFNRRREQGLPIHEAVRRGCLDRLRPVAMTALMAALGLLPAAFATVLTLLLLPILYLAFHEEPQEQVQH